MAFKFGKRNLPLDWKKISSINIELILKENDYSILQENIANIVFCDIINEFETEENNPILIKLFQMSQLIMEYLLFSQDCFLQNIQQLQKQINQMKEAEDKINEKNKKQFEKQDKEKSEMERWIREAHKRKKIIINQQKLLKMHEHGFKKCQHCDKIFMSEKYLQAHIMKNHSNLYESNIENRRTRKKTENTKESADIAKSNEEKLKTALDEKEKARKSITRLEKELEKIKNHLSTTKVELEEARQKYEDTCFIWRGGDEVMRKEVDAIRKDYNDKLKVELEKRDQKWKDTIQKEVVDEYLKLKNKSKESGKANDSVAGELSFVEQPSDPENVDVDKNMNAHERLFISNESAEKTLSSSILNTNLIDNNNKKTRKGDMTETSEWSVSSADVTRSDFEDEPKIIQNFKTFNSEYNPIKKRNGIINKVKSRKTLNKKAKKKVNKKNLENISEHEPDIFNKNEKANSQSEEERKENTGVMNNSAKLKSSEEITEDKTNANILDEWFENKKKAQQKEELKKENMKILLINKKKAQQKEELKKENMKMPLINSWESSEERSDKEDIKNVGENLEETKTYLLHLITEKLQSMGVKPQTNVGDESFDKASKVLQYERSICSEKLHKFDDIRQHYMQWCQEMAANKMKTQGYDEETDGSCLSDLKSSIKKWSSTEGNEKIKTNENQLTQENVVITKSENETDKKDEMLSENISDLTDDVSLSSIEKWIKQAREEAGSDVDTPSN